MRHIEIRAIGRRSGRSRAEVPSRRVADAAVESRSGRGRLTARARLGPGLPSVGWRVAIDAPLSRLRVSGRRLRLVSCVCEGPARQQAPRHGPQTPHADTHDTPSTATPAHRTAHSGPVTGAWTGGRARASSRRDEPQARAETASQRNRPLCTGSNRIQRRSPGPCKHSSHEHAACSRHPHQPACTNQPRGPWPDRVLRRTWHTKCTAVRLYIVQQHV